MRESRMMRLLVSFFVFLCCGAQAEDSLTIGLHVASVHIPSISGYNDFNPGLYLRESSYGATAGFYRNSFSRPSYYVGWTGTLKPFSIMLGAVTGYEKRKVMGGGGGITCLPDALPNTCWHYEGNGHAVEPMIAPSVLIGPARIWFIPKLIASMDASVIHLSVEHSF